MKLNTSKGIHRRRRRTAALAVAALALALPAVAQTDEEEDVFVLPPFEVMGTEGRGYLVTETTSATRFAVDRRDLPFSITSLSGDLLDDAYAVNAIEALDLASSATPEGNVFSGNDNRPMIRGTLSPRFFVGGIFYNSTEAPGGIAVDSIEILKGTSAMLYGQGEPGGTVNYQLKRPSTEFSGRAQAMLGSYNEWEARLEVSGPIDSEANLTYFLGYSQYYGENQHDRFSDSSADGFARLRWEYDGSNRFVDLYHIYSNSERNGIVQHILDGHHGITNLQMKANIFRQFTSEDLPNPLDLGMMDPESHNDAAEGSFAHIRSNSTTATWNHGFADRFTFRASYNRTKMPRYVWRNLADPTRHVEANPSRNYLFTDPETGLPEIITTVRGDIIKNTGGQLRDDALKSDSYVVNLLGDFNVGPVDWKTVVGVDRISEVFETQSFFSNWHYNQAANGTAQLGAFGDRIPIILGSVFRPEEGLTAESEPLSSYTIDGGWSSSENKGTGYYWTNFLQFFGGDLSIVGSIRHDRTSLTVEALREARTDGEDPFIGGTPVSFNKTTYSIGGNWHFLRHWGVFANYATSFRPEVSGRQGRDRQPIGAADRDPFEGEGWDAGLKFATEDGRFFVMGTVFQAKKRNLWTRQRDQEVDADGNLVWEDEDQTIPSLVSFEAQTGEQLAEGVELEMTGALTDNLQLRFGWTWLYTAEISKDEEEFLVGQRLRSSPEHKISAGINYTIREGFLSFSSLGFNVTSLIDDRIYWVDPNNRALNVGALGDGSPYVGEADRFWGKGYTRVDFFWRKRFVLPDDNHLWLRLNVYNIFDKDHQRWRSIGVPRSVRVSVDYRW
ncbi:MAG: TonB-dependent receptor [Opitutales bacterium]|nr:TonB-dependent receptor [Opitutales bacterium]